MKAPAVAVAAPPLVAGSRPRFSLGRIIRIVLAVALVAAGAAIYTPQLLYMTSSDAVLNARVVALSAPIDGRVVQAPPAEGTVVNAKEPLVKIENPIVDRSRVQDLEAMRTRTEAELAGAKHLITALTTQIDNLDSQIAAYRAATLTRLVLVQEEAKADSTAADATAADARHNYDRKKALRSASTISIADLDQAEQSAARAEATAERARFSVRRIGEEIAAAKQGIFVAADRNDVPYSQQRLDEFRVRKAEAEAQAATLAARLDELDRQVLTERVRAAGLAATELTAPVAGVVWRPAVFSGAPVARNAELLALIDCSEIFVTATFSGRAFDDLHPGRHASVHVLGTDTNYPATVVDTRAMQGTNVEERFAAPLPKLGERQILAVLRLDNPKALASEKYCNVGRRVEVRFQDRPPAFSWLSF